MNPLIERLASSLAPVKRFFSKPPLEGSYVYIFSFLVGYMIADLSLLSFRSEMIPSQPPPARPVAARKMRPPLQDYDLIKNRNIFNSTGEIPPALRRDDAQEESEEDNLNLAVKSQLPLKLEGTIVHVNPNRSMATVTSSSRNETSSYKVNDEIDNIARVLKVERRKLIFRNINNGRLEYIEIPEEAQLTFGFKPKKGQEVVKQGEFNFQVNRADITKYTSNLADVLSQARMVPNVVPGSGGAVEGFRFVSIQPGSIYEKLGFKSGDVIKQVNREDVNSPTKAMELYNSLKSERSINLQVERNGRVEEFTYDISD